MHFHPELIDMSKTWNLTLTATDTHPETTVEGVSQEDAIGILRGLMHGPSSAEYAYVEAARGTMHADRHEASLAA
jgi:hypothetical protein